MRCERDGVYVALASLGGWEKRNKQPPGMLVDNKREELNKVPHVKAE